MKKHGNLYDTANALPREDKEYKSEQPEGNIL